MGITPTVDGAKLCQDTVALLYGRIAALESREAALVAALRQADWALLHCEQLDDQSIYQARLEIAAALVAATDGKE